MGFTENPSQWMDSSPMEYEQILEEIGFGKTQWSLILITGLLTLFEMSSITSVSIIALQSQCDFGMSQSEKGILMAASSTGIFLSSYIWGFISDLYGRYRVIVYTSFAGCLLMFISIFVTNLWVFIVLTLVVGICIGGFSNSSLVYLSEFNTANNSVMAINYAAMFVSVSTIYSPVTAWIVLSFDWSWDLMLGMTLRPWRLLILLNFLPGLIATLWLLPYPESPKILLAQNKEKEALDAVEWICQNNHGCSLSSHLKRQKISLYTEKASEDDVTTKQGYNLFALIWKATVPLFQKEHRRNFLLSATVMLLMFFGANGMQVWFPEIVNRAMAEGEGDNSVTICGLLKASFEKQASNTTTTATVTSRPLDCITEPISRNTYISNIIVGAAFLVGYLLQGVILKIFKRKNTLLGAFAISSLSCLLLQFMKNPLIILIMFSLYIIMVGLSVSTMFSAIIDFLPTTLRGKALTFCSSLGFLGVLLATYLIGVSLETMCIETFAVFAALLMVAGVLILFLPIQN